MAHRFLFFFYLLIDTFNVVGNQQSRFVSVAVNSCSLTSFSFFVLLFMKVIRNKKKKCNLLSRNNKAPKSFVLESSLKKPSWNNFWQKVLEAPSINVFSQKTWPYPHVLLMFMIMFTSSCVSCYHRNCRNILSMLLL